MPRSTQKRKQKGRRLFRRFPSAAPDVPGSMRKLRQRHRSTVSAQWRQACILQRLFPQRKIILVSDRKRQFILPLFFVYGQNISYIAPPALKDMNILPIYYLKPGRMVMLDKYIIVKESDSYFFNSKGYLLQNMNGGLPFWIMGKSLEHFNVVACLLKVS
jgi:hypothetical protein